MANILLLGDQGLGKPWINRIVGETFSESYMTTLGKTMKEVEVVDRENIYTRDIGGNERFQEVNVYYQIADGALIFYDVSKHNGFERINWKNKLNGNYTVRIGR